MMGSLDLHFHSNSYLARRGLSLPPWPFYFLLFLVIVHCARPERLVFYPSTDYSAACCFG
jgi:hypothetical protein